MIFVKEPELKVLAKWDKEYKPRSYRLQSEMAFYWKAKGSIVEIPKGFVTDLASVPCLLRPIFNPGGLCRYSAIVHDYLYDCLGWVATTHNRDRSGELIRRASPLVKRYTRKEADEIFYEALLCEGMAKWKAALMYRGVRVFGGYHTKQWKS